MDIIEGFLGDFTWKGIIPTGMRNILILLLAWIAMKVMQNFCNVWNAI